MSTEPRCHESLSSTGSQHSHTLSSLKHPHNRKPIGFPFSEEDLLFGSGTKQAKQFPQMHRIRMFIQSTLRILRILGTHICDNNFHIRKNVSRQKTENLGLFIKLICLEYTAVCCLFKLCGSLRNDFIISKQSCIFHCIDCIRRLMANCNLNHGVTRGHPENSLEKEEIKAFLNSFPHHLCNGVKDLM